MFFLDFYTKSIIPIFVRVNFLIFYLNDYICCKILPLTRRIFCKENSVRRLKNSVQTLLRSARLLYRPALPVNHR